MPFSQVGNPEGPDKPNKKYYDPRVWIRKSEESMIVRAKNAFVSLNGVNVLGDGWAKKWETEVFRSASGENLVKTAFSMNASIFDLPLKKDET